MGAWYPLSVWKTKGYNTENIESGCETNMMMSSKSVFEKHVTIDTERDIQRKVKDEIVNLRQPGLRSSLSHYASNPNSKEEKDQPHTPTLKLEQLEQFESNKSENPALPVSNQILRQREGALPLKPGSTMPFS